MENDEFSSWKHNTDPESTQSEEPVMQPRAARSFARSLDDETAMTPAPVMTQPGAVPPANQPLMPRKSSSFNPAKRKKMIRIVGTVIAVLVVVLGIFGFVGYQAYVQAMAIKGELDQAQTEGRAAYDSFKAQDLNQVQAHIQAAREHVVLGQTDLGKMAWASKVPVASKYYKDAQAGFDAALNGSDAALEVVAAIQPHADVLGFNGQGTFTGGTTEDRLGLMLQTLAEIQPQLDGISQKVTAMNTDIAEIDPNDYPVEFRGTPIRARIQQLHDLGSAADTALTTARPVIEQLPNMAGAGPNGRQKYLVIFQNDNELRPTGGFMTAYAVIFAEKGKITPEKSDDIYPLDVKFRNKPPIPPELGKYLTTETKWNLRDMNTDPNFENSMKTFYSYYKTLPGEPQNINGVIAIDTNVLTKIIDVIGPVEIPGYGTFSNENDPRCDCPQIIYALSEIIDRPTPFQRENRKGILAPLMQAIIQKTYATQRDKWPLLAQTAWNSIEGRDVQMYFFDETEENAAKSINAAGIIPQMPKTGDYLTVVDANLGGAKSNLFVTANGTQEIESIANGQLTKTVELTYKNNHAASNCNLEAGQLCLNGELNDWTRWYVPKGVKVSDAAGFVNNYEVDTSNPDYDVISGVFKLAPMSQIKVRVKYTVPYNGSDKSYTLSMQKQGGAPVIPYSLSTPFGDKDFNLDKDITVSVP